MTVLESTETQAPKGLYRELVETSPRYRGLGNKRTKRVVRVSDTNRDGFHVSVQIRLKRGFPDHMVYNFFLNNQDRVRNLIAGEMRLVDDHWLPRELLTPDFSKILREIRIAQRKEQGLKIHSGSVSFS